MWYIYTFNFEDDISQFVLVEEHLFQFFPSFIIEEGSNAGIQEFLTAVDVVANCFQFWQFHESTDIDNIVQIF